MFFLTGNGILQDGYKGIGIYWAWDEESADAHWGRGGEFVTIAARIPAKAIDFKRMLLANIDSSTGINEAEITLKEGAQVELMYVITGSETIDLPSIKIGA